MINYYILCEPGRYARALKNINLDNLGVDDRSQLKIARHQFIDDTDIVIIATKIGTTPNRAIYNEDGTINYIIKGIFLLAREENKKLVPLTREQAKCYKEMFFKPQKFFRAEKTGKLIAVDYAPPKA